MSITIKYKSVFTTLCFFCLFFHPLFAQLKIEKLDFFNNANFSDSDLEDIIHSEEGEEYEPRLIKLDQILLSNFYRQKGFLNIEIADSILSGSERDKINITYYVNEGQRFYFGGVRLKGNKDLTNKKIIDQFGNQELNTHFDEASINESVKKVENLYYNSGKPFIELDTKYLFDQDSLVIILIDIIENQTVYIKNVEYYGQKLVQQFLIRREMEIKKGEKYSRIALEKSQNNLYGTGLFKYVRLEIEPIKDEPEQVVLKILVQEKEPTWVGVRLGMAHEQQAYYGNKMEFTVQGGHRNLFGTARTISLHVTPSITYDFDENKLHNLDNKIALRFVEPWIGNTRTPGVFQLSYEQYRPLFSGNFDLLAASFDVRRKYGEYIQVSGAISAKLVDQITDEAIDSSLVRNLDVSKSQVYSLTFYGKRDKRENLFNPQNSSYTDLSLGFSYSSGKDKTSKVVNNQYITFISSWQRYQPFRPKVFSFKRWHFTLASRLKVGAIFETGKKQTIPINDLFFAGGASSVRGYQEQLLGPALVKDQKGRIEKAAGGKLLYLGNLEVRMPIYWIFVLETFLDSGYVWPEVSSFSPADIKITTGIGLAVITPLGPVRIDYGYKLIQTDTDPSPDALHFGIYFAF